ncbi:helix-turn-helix domain-containing protein [Spirillospora sp. NPDC047279]|uniref:PucR family transcriptional regulator n=1 Tax=Spirillospora sp. NPDC047279 TaxID=3155478 RepID=UPI0033FC613B
MATTEPADGTIMRMAAARLTDHLPQLADRLFSEIHGGDGGHRTWVRDDDLREVCEVGLGHGLETILHPTGGRADLRWAERLGRRRAEQGQPLDQLLRSYRLAGRIFWEGIVEVVDREDPAAVAMLLQQTSRTWEAIDQQSRAAADSYHRTESLMRQRDAARTRTILDALLSGRGVDGGLLATASSVLGLPLQGRYAVAVLSRPAHPPAHSGTMRLIWRTTADAQIALVALGAAGLDDLVAVLRPHVRDRAGVSIVVGSLAEIGAAHRLARTALRTTPSSGSDGSARGEIAVLGQRLPSALLVSEPRLAERLERTVLGGLDAVKPGHRDVLLATLGAWLDCDGAAGRAARVLYCHPNTVLTRLRRLEQLTGRSLSRPRDLVELTLALHAQRLTDGDDEGGDRTMRPPPEQANVQGGPPAYASGNASGNAHGSAHGSAPGAAHGNSPGSVQGNAPGAVHGNAAGAVQGNAPGDVQANAPGDVPAGGQPSGQVSWNSEIVDSLGMGQRNWS